MRDLCGGEFFGKWLQATSTRAWLGLEKACRDGPGRITVAGLLTSSGVDGLKASGQWLLADFPCGYHFSKWDGPYALCLNTWPPSGGPVWEGQGGASQEEEVTGGKPWVFLVSPTSCDWLPQGPAIMPSLLWWSIAPRTVRQNQSFLP